MSMPNFPDGISDITCDQAFNMLLGSIAMEEMALSHIMNAEGEKLQYVLGTLPGSPCRCSTAKEILQVNHSISDLLEKVAYNQLLLKGKLQQVIEARTLCAPPAAACPPQPPCMCVWTAEKKRPWQCGCPLLWRQNCTRGDCISWQKCSPASVYFVQQGSYFTSISIWLRACEPGPVQVTLRKLNGGVSHPVLTCEAHACKCNVSLHISGCTTLTERDNDFAVTPFQLVLDAPQSVFLEQAEWCITAI